MSNSQIDQFQEALNRAQGVEESPLIQPTISSLQERIANEANRIIGAGGGKPLSPDFKDKFGQPEYQG